MSEGPGMGSAGEIFRVFLRLGLTSFGGPIAHLGYFHDEFVKRRAWLDEGRYADLVALCQFLPGPASSQVGMAVGLLRAGYLGGIAAWLAFTLPSALILIAFAYLSPEMASAGGGGWVHGLKIAAVAVVAVALLSMARSLTPDRGRATIAVIAAAIVLFLPFAWAQIAAIVVGGAAGLLFLKANVSVPGAALSPPVGRGVAIVSLAIFVVLLAGLPVLAALTKGQFVTLVDVFYRAGSLVFGGGHVVLPLLQAEVVPRGWVTDETFLAGYGAAQAMPGPLFAFAAFLGAASVVPPNGLIGGLICLIAIFLPSTLLVTGALPFWDSVRTRPSLRNALAGVNAAVVGLLAAAFYDPVWSSAILTTADFAIAAVAFLLLFAWRTPPWLVVIFCAAAGAIVNSI
jgi:chromate transporter